MKPSNAIFYAIVIFIIAGCSRTAEHNQEEGPALDAPTLNAMATNEAPKHVFVQVAPSKSQAETFKLDYQPFATAGESAAVIIPSVDPVPSVVLSVNSAGKYEVTLEQKECKSKVELMGLTSNADEVVGLSVDHTTRIEFEQPDNEPRNISVKMEAGAPNNWNCNVAFRKIG